MTTPSEVCTCDCDPHRWWCRDYQESDLPYGADTEVIEFSNGPDIWCPPEHTAAILQMIEHNTRLFQARGWVDGHPDGAA